MLKKIFNLKVFLLGALFTMIFSSMAFASSENVDVPYSILKNNSNVCVAWGLNGSTATYYVLVSPSSESNFKAVKCDIGYYDGTRFTNNGRKFKVYTYEYYQNDETKLSDSLKFKYVGEFDKYEMYRYPDVLYSTNDVLGSDGVFFSKKPIPSMMEIVKELPKSVVKQMGIILPVGISALCLVVLVPYLVRFIKRFV